VSFSWGSGRSWLLRAAVAAVTAGLVAGTTLSGPAQAAAGLPLGDADLKEVRTVSVLAPGVELTTIVRGTKPAKASRIRTTTRGPWRVRVLTIDPRVAGGHLEAVYGTTLSRVATTSSLADSVGGLAAVNASYFTFNKNPAYPGDPVGLGLYRGHVLSDPAAVRPEVDFLLDAATGVAFTSRLTWSGSIRNPHTGATLVLDHLNSPPVVPSRCRKLHDPTRCGYAGQLVWIDRAFGPTPKGKGVEVVLDRAGCLVRKRKSRGTVLAAGQRAVQATGVQSGQLLRLVKHGCLARKVALYDEDGTVFVPTSSTFGVSARYRLTQEGAVVPTTATGGYAARNPRTLVGTTADGRIRLVTIDGRSTHSVGTTMSETAAVAHDVGLVDSVNLDGGGSSTMVVAGEVVNHPSGRSERAVGDALVYIDKPFR
jgi:exopolysaccharide biosynthesis protein